MAKQKQKPKTNSNILALWPTTILSKRFAHHQKVNPVLMDLVYKHRDREQRSPKNSYASKDDLLNQYPLHKELNELADFFREGIFEISKASNQGMWKDSDTVKINMTGLWFQISNGFAFHETHVHGNCSWSGVYYVQAGESSESRESIKPGDQPNGITRFYGPNMENMAGGYGDYGNFYLHDSSWDSYPQDGKLVIFPSYLKHMVFPYNGKNDRVIFSFHAQVDKKGGLTYDYSMAN
jgi:uncharacterized protein (TIGR02466 family)